MPQLTAATCAVSGSLLITPSAISLLTASRSATQPPVIAAQRVPPSACSTSQSTVICRSPSATRSIPARRLRPISRWISCVRPDCLPARRLAPVPRRGRPRQHAVLGGDPAEPGLAQERRHALLEARGAEHVGVADPDQARPLGMPADAGLDRDGAQRVGGAAGRAHGRLPSSYPRAPLSPAEAGDPAGRPAPAFLLPEIHPPEAPARHAPVPARDPSELTASGRDPKSGPPQPDPRSRP